MTQFKSVGLLIRDEALDDPVVPRGDVSHDGLFDFEARCNGIGEFSLFLKSDVDVQVAFCELMLDPIDDLSVQSGVSPSANDSFQACSSKRRVRC